VCAIAVLGMTNVQDLTARPPMRIEQREEKERGQNMPAWVGFPSKKEMAELTARMLLEVEAVRFMEDKPFIFTSGWASPVYTDCRRLISFPRVRQTLIDFGAATLFREVGLEQFDTVVGGETAGIPFAAWMADRLMLPMQYVRKKPKGFGRNAQIEGHLEPGQRVLLVEDLTTDGRSKVNFCNALRAAGATVEHIFVIFYYGIYPESQKVLSDLNITLHYLCTWWDVLDFAKMCGQFDPIKLAEIEKFLHDPVGWSKAHGGVATAAAE
jgi:orotate phosphoribosyltransferase